MDTIEEEKWALSLLEPQVFALPKWAVETFEKHGGVFKGKTVNPDGSVTITGIERFTDDYLQSVQMIQVA